MFIYQFIKFNDKTSIKNISKFSGSGTTICFDFEDSVNDWINPVNTKKLKADARNNFCRIYKFLAPVDNILTGVRINSPKDSEQEKDLNVLSGKKINSVWIPKIENIQDIIFVSEKLKFNKTCYEEIIPIIETKTALRNLSSILNHAKGLFSKIAFGHSDYNLSINSIPFIHQYNSEYWKWVDKALRIISEYKMLYINSAFLYLNDLNFFGKMLSHLYQLLGENFGQVTLTSLQSGICTSFDKEFRGFKRLIDNRSDLRVPDGYAENFVKAFENQNQKRGFTVDKKDNVLLSPQEYVASKKYLKEKKSKTIEIVFTGGCFPVQYNILFEELFHQKLKLFLNNNGIEMNLKLIRYERFRDTQEKIFGYCSKNQTDLLIFHIRPEPFFRLLKLYYKYNSREGETKRALNIPFLNSIKPEEFDVYDIARNLENYSENSGKKSNPLKADINYIAGTISGNLHYAVNQYLNLSSLITDYCRKNDIKFIILGPLIRYCSNTELLFSKYFRKKIVSYCRKNGLNFIDGVPRNKEKIVCLEENGKFATQEYHDYIASQIFHKISLINFRRIKWHSKMII